MKYLFILPLIALSALASMAASDETGAPAPTKASLKSPLKSILRFTSNDGVDFNIDENKKLISAIFVVVGDVDIQNLYYKPTIVVSDKATVSPASGEKRDFINPVDYTVTAEDGTQVHYTAEVVIYNYSGADSNAKFGGATGGMPQKLPWTYLMASETDLFSGTWEFAYSGALEVRQVESDEVLTLLEQTPTTQTVTVKVNDTEKPPTQSSGQFGWRLTLNPNKTYTSISDLGDTASGQWNIVDLGTNALLRYELRLDGITVIAGGPSASGVTTWYITGISRSAMYLTHDPIVTSSSTTTFDVTLIAAHPNAVSYQFSAPKSGTGGLALSWNWGTPPFRVQFKGTVSDAWSDVATQNDRTYNAALQGQSGFYRIIGSGGN